MKSNHLIKIIAKGYTVYEKTITWKSEYNIGNYRIDQEHQKLFQLAQKALTTNHLNNSTKEKVVVKELIVELYTYIKTHFQHEQEHMKAIHYPEYEHHKNIHKSILENLNSLVTTINTLEVQEIEQKLFNFIEEYFVNHIILEDKRIQLWNTPLEELRKNFGWKDIYSVKDENIDSEHKQLFDITQEAFHVVDNEHRPKKIKEVLTRLYDYMKLHFEHEEVYMRSIEYPLLEEQIHLHKDIIETLNNFVKNLPNIEIELFEKELARLIDITLVQHIIQEDRKIMNWVNKQN